MLKKIHISIVIMVLLLVGMVMAVHMMVPSTHTSNLYNWFAFHWRWIGSALCLTLSAWLQIVHFRLRWAAFFILMSVAFLVKLPTSLPGAF
jgi:cell division protein FtsW (lipid II flippase)